MSGDQAGGCPGAPAEDERHTRRQPRCTRSMQDLRALGHRAVRHLALGRWCGLTQILFYGLPWLMWNERQAVLFDLVSRRFYIGGLVLYPQDLIYLSALLMISAYALFLFTAVAGRLWCGYACPQTVYTEIFMWIERRIEGDRQRRMKLDEGPWTFGKVWRKGASRWPGSRSACGPASPSSATSRRSARWAPASCGLGPGALGTFWILFYGFATYGNAGFMREQVCKYMCPYARFQSAMFDKDTLIISYDTERGEPRGSRATRRPTTRAGPGRVRGLRPVRAGLPDRHRHPQRAAVRVHRLRRLRGRVRRRDGQDGLPARPGALRHAERPGAAPRQGQMVRASCGRGCWSTPAS
jgi:hypothetical protein